MKTILLLAILALAAPALAADEKIDPSTFICAELVATATDAEPPIFEGLQIDGYASGIAGKPAADASTLRPMLLEVYDACTVKPAEKVLDHWLEVRKRHEPAEDGPWRADKTTCADYFANEDDGSGFVIWLDGYQRARTGKKASVFTDQATLDHFLEVCKASPDRLMIDVMTENAR